MPYLIRKAAPTASILGPALAGAAPVIIPTSSATSCKVNQYLNCSFGTYAITASPAIPRVRRAWQWRRNDGSQISGATDILYRVAAADIGKRVFCREFTTDINGTTYQDTPLSAIVVAEDRAIVDASTWGLKTSQTTGSMTAGSPILTVLSAAGFSVGDQIIVATGGEAGLGLRATRGVGGQWPERNYTSLSAMNADTTQPAYSFAHCDETTRTYRWNPNTPAWEQWFFNTYYWNTRIPVGVVAKIIAINGLEFTLEKIGQPGVPFNAVLSTSNAPVHFDNFPILNPKFNYPGGTSVGHDKIVDLPAGFFAMSGPFVPRGLNNVLMRGKGVKGSPTETRFFSPWGVPSFGGVPYQCLAFDAEFCHFVGNALDNGYGPPVESIHASINGLSASTVTQGQKYTTGFCRTAGYIGVTENWTSTDQWTNAVGSSQGHWYHWARYVKIYSKGFQSYIQWMALFADCKGGGTIDCEIDSERLNKAFETFRADQISHIRPIIKNCLNSSNTSGNFLFDRPQITFTANCHIGQISINAQGEPIFNINANIGTTSGGNGIDLTTYGGEVRDPTVIFEGFINPNRNVLRAMVISPVSRGVWMTGKYPANPGNEKRGLIQWPTYQAPILEPDPVYGYGPDGRRGITSDNGTDCGVVGCRFVGGTPTWGDQINFTIAGTAVDCIVDDVSKVKAAVKSGIISNTAYLAGGGT